MDKIDTEIVLRIVLRIVLNLTFDDQAWQKFSSERKKEENILSSYIVQVKAIYDFDAEPGTGEISIRTGEVSWLLVGFW